MASSLDSAPLVGPAPSADTAELDQLLSGMLMNVQNIRDIRPSQRHVIKQQPDIDVDSIQVRVHLLICMNSLTIRRDGYAKNTPGGGQYRFSAPLDNNAKPFLPLATPSGNTLDHEAEQY